MHKEDWLMTQLCCWFFYQQKELMQPHICFSTNCLLELVLKENCRGKFRHKLANSGLWFINGACNVRGQRRKKKKDKKKERMEKERTVMKQERIGVTGQRRKVDDRGAMALSKKQNAILMTSWWENFHLYDHVKAVQWFTASLVIPFFQLAAGKSAIGRTSLDEKA